MITVTALDDGILVEGHAHYAPVGQDIVCAGVTALVQTLVISMEKLTEDLRGTETESGRSRLYFVDDLSAQGALLVASFFIGVFTIAKEFPKHVMVSGWSEMTVN